MICPHCGNQTANTGLCDHCGCPTEFAVRTNYQSVGTSSNESSYPYVKNSELNPPPPAQGNHTRPETPDSKEKVPSAKPHPPQVPGQPRPPVQNRPRRKKSNVELLLPWILGAVAILLVGCIAVTIAFSWLLKKIDNLNDQISSIKHSTVEQDTREIPTTAAISETFPEGIEDWKNANERLDAESTTVPEVTGIVSEEETTSEAAEIQIMFDVNPLEKMKMYGLSPETPEAISIEQLVPSLDDVTDSFSGYTWVFQGWNTKSDGTGFRIERGQTVDLPLSKSITLFAQWEECNVFRPPLG